MRNQLLSILLLSASVAACTGRDPTSAELAATDGFGNLSQAKVELIEEGGFAALRTSNVVRHDDRSFVYTRRQICNNGCAPMDSASGTLSAAATDSLFTVIWAQNPFAFKDDYGPTAGGADMVTYTLRMTFEGKTKTVRADDGTMPQQMRQIVSLVHGTISAARR